MARVARATPKRASRMTITSWMKFAQRRGLSFLRQIEFLGAEGTVSKVYMLHL